MLSSKQSRQINKNWMTILFFLFYSYYYCPKMTELKTRNRKTKGRRINRFSFEDNEFDYTSRIIKKSANPIKGSFAAASTSSSFKAVMARS